MPGRNRITGLPVLAAVLMALALLAPAAAVAQQNRPGDYWGEKIPGQPTQFIFGYGSLIDDSSRNSTAAAPIPAIPVRVSRAFGYLRAWVDHCACGFTALGLRQPRPGEAAMTINGVLYPVEGSDMTAFDAREAGYRRIGVPLDEIEALSWQRLPETGAVWVYIPVGRDGVAGSPDLPGPTAEQPLLQSYIDVVLRGGLEYGPAFAREIIATTADWNGNWLNDRELARRPWVFNKDAAAIDDLLRQTSPAARYFGDRLFPEAFAVRRLAPADAR